VPQPEPRRRRKESIKADNADRKPARPTEAPRQAPNHDQDNRGGRHRRGRDNDESDGTVGFGDDMPAFMKISVRA